MTRVLIAAEDMQLHNRFGYSVYNVALDGRFIYEWNCLNLRQMVVLQTNAESVCGGAWVGNGAQSGAIWAKMRRLEPAGQAENQE